MSAPIRVLRHQQGGDRALHFLHRLHAGVLFLLVDRLGDLRFGFVLQPRDKIRRRFGLRPRHLGRRAGDLEEFVLVADQFPDPLLAQRERLEHVRLGDFEAAAFDHVDRIRRAGHDDFEVAVGQLLERRVQHPLVLDPSDAHAGDRAVPGNAARCQRIRGRHQSQHIRVILLVARNDVDVDLDFVLEAVGEERPDGPVDDAGCQDFVIVRAPLSLDEAAGDLSRGIGLFPVLDQEREKAEGGFPVAHGHGGQDHGVTERDNGASGSLLRHAPGLDDEAP